MMDSNINVIIIDRLGVLGPYLTTNVWGGRIGWVLIRTWAVSQNWALKLHMYMDICIYNFNLHIPYPITLHESPSQ